MKVERIFDEQARERVKAAVKRAEELSRGQIVPVVVERSDPYRDTRARGAAALAALATGAYLAIASDRGATELVILQVVAALVGMLLPSIEPVERFLAGGHSMNGAVRARALRAFHENGLERTKEGTGVLVFASLFERQAVVLGDYGIHAKMGDAEWNRTVDALVEQMRRGNPAAGFEEAIALCGGRLAEHFPRDASAPPPTNELEDSIRTSKS